MKAGGEDIGRQVVCERRRQEGQPAQSGKRHQHTRNARQKGRTENEVADQQAVESEKCERVDGEVEMKERTNGSKGASHKAGACGEERQAFVYPLKQGIEENGHGDIARRDQAQGHAKPAVKDESGYSRQEREQIK